MKYFANAYVATTYKTDFCHTRCIRDPCDGVYCNDHGDCDPGDGICDCDLEYVGDFCQACAAGYHWEGLDCVPD